jgi:hypothetical protein
MDLEPRPSKLKLEVPNNWLITALGASLATGNSEQLYGYGKVGPRRWR